LTRLNSEGIKGIWAGLTMSWDEKDRLDEATYRANTERLCRAHIHGIYTTGSTGEFYALDLEEFRQMVDIQAEICGTWGIPLQIGCCGDSTRKVIRLLEYAAQKAQVGAVQVVVPYWMELNDKEVLQFFKDLYAACPEMPLVHYNIPRAKRFLTGLDYQRILQVAPTLVGVKFTMAGTHFGQLQQALLMTPELSYFVSEDLLVSAMMLGARGSYSSLVCTDPNFMLTLYEHSRCARWAEALEMQAFVAKFFDDVASLIESRGEGSSDPVFDKGLAVASGCLLGSARTRAPYIGWREETVLAVREWLVDRYPQFIFPLAERRCT
jgi:dihydrodipicolinate synthase/N-acetylneuraminate lyase